MSPAEAFNTKPGNSQRVILVVDDESGIGEFLAAYLQSKDFKVFTAASAEEALNLWGEIRSKVSLLITDIIMPGLNGKLLAEKLMAEKPTLKVIFMSGYLPEEVAEEKSWRQLLPKAISPARVAKGDSRSSPLTITCGRTRPCAAPVSLIFRLREEATVRMLGPPWEFSSFKDYLVLALAPFCWGFWQLAASLLRRRT